MFENESSFVSKLKKQMLKEFSCHDRNGVYAYTQKSMAYNSNKIEGSTLTSEQTASLFDTGSIVGEDNEIYRAKDIEEMTGHFKMFNEVLKNLEAPLNIEMIKSFHFQLKSGVFEDYANGYPIGEFKKYKNQVSDIETELPQNIPHKIGELVDQYNKSDKTLEDIVKFHAAYEKIHPFQDGNGRTGRAIILKQCFDANIVPVIVSDNEKLLYYQALHMAQTEHQYGKLLEFFKKEQKKYYENVKDFVIPFTEKEQASSFFSEPKEEDLAELASSKQETDKFTMVAGSSVKDIENRAGLSDAPEQQEEIEHDEQTSEEYEFVD